MNDVIVHSGGYALKRLNHPLVNGLVVPDVLKVQGCAALFGDFAKDSQRVSNDVCPIATIVPGLF